MEPTENRPESRTPGLIGLGLLVALAIGFGLGQKFASDGGEPERLPAPSAPSIFQLPLKLVVYQQGPAIPQLWLDTFSSGLGNPKIDLRVLERSSDVCSSDLEIDLLSRFFHHEIMGRSAD